MIRPKFVEVDKDKFIRLDEIKAFYRKDEIFVTGDLKKPTRNYSYGVIVLLDNSKNDIPIEYFEKLKKTVKDEKENT